MRWRDKDNQKDNTNTTVEWTCGECYDTLTASTNAELGAKVVRHLETHSNQS